MLKKIMIGSLATLVVAVSAVALANAATVTTVTPSNMQGWTFVNDQTDATSTATGKMVNGPGTPPLGTGSAELTATTTTDGQILEKAAYQGVKFTDVTKLQYSTFQNASNTSNATAIALQFNVDKDVADADNTYQGRIIYEPYMNNGGSVPLGTWNTWNAASSTAVWWFSKSSTKFDNNCSQATPCTLSQIIALYPNIGIHPTLGAVVFKAGSGWTAFDGNVDALTIGVNGNDTTYNFELVTPDTTAPAAPLPVSPANHATTTTAGLTKVDWTDVTDPSSPVTYIYQASLSPATSTDGSFVAPVYTSGPLTASEIPTPGTPEGTYYWHANATDSVGNVSPWSTTWSFTVSNSTTTPPTPGPTNKDQCKDNGWKSFTNPSFKNQGQCVSSVANGK